MAYHKSNLGAFGGSITSDMDGYIPEAGDGPWDLAVDHGGLATRDEDGELTEYGEWWEEEGFPEWQEQAIAATEQASEACSEWQEENA